MNKAILDGVKHINLLKYHLTSILAASTENIKVAE